MSAPDQVVSSVTPLTEIKHKYMIESRFIARIVKSVEFQSEKTNHNVKVCQLKEILWDQKLLSEAQQASRAAPKVAMHPNFKCHSSELRFLKALTREIELILPNLIEEMRVINCPRTVWEFFYWSSSRD